MAKYVYNHMDDDKETAIRRVAIEELRKPQDIKIGTVFYSALNAIDKKIWKESGTVPEEKKDSAIYHTSDVVELYAIAMQGFHADIMRSYLLVLDNGGEFILVGGMSIETDTYRNKVSYSLPRHKSSKVKDIEGILKMAAQQKWCHLEFVNSEKK